MKPEAFDNIYFIGIGGIGMSALARFFNVNGKMVAGYDKTPSPLTDALQNEGMTVHFDDDPAHIPEKFLDEPANSLIVYTPAIPEENKIFNYFEASGYYLYKRSVILGLLSESKFTIAVGGAHGKTSTCAFIAHLLKTAGIDFYGFLGGIATNYATNFIRPDEGSEANILLAEADEYDRSFLQLTPNVTVLTSGDPDHLDIYGTQQDLLNAYGEFAQQTKSDGLLVHHQVMDLPVSCKELESLSFGLSAADWYADNIQVVDNRYEFDLLRDGQKTAFQCGVPGDHNVLNVIAGCAAVKDLINDEATYQQAAHSFKGVKRRFEYILEEPSVVFVDDYAHHPQELNFAIQTLQKLYPADNITGLFQPHLYSRTRDFANGFAEVLQQLDRVILLPIYPAREKPIEGVSSQMILDKIDHSDKHLLKKEEVAHFIREDQHKIITTLGAGDIDRLVQPIRKTLEESRLS